MSTLYYETLSHGDDFLMHHGIKGMKWGIRRYQNPDGTLTRLGRERARYSSNMAGKQVKLEEKQEKYYTNMESALARGDVGAALSYRNKHRRASQKQLNLNDQVIAQEKYNRHIDLKRQSSIDNKIYKAEQKGQTKKVEKLKNKKAEIDKDLSLSETRVKLSIQKGEKLVSTNKILGYKVLEEPGYKRYVSSGREELNKTMTRIAAFSVGGPIGVALILGGVRNKYIEGTKYKLK